MQLKKLYGLDSDTVAINILDFARGIAQKKLQRTDYNIFGSNTDLYDPELKIKPNNMPGGVSFDLIILMAVLEHLSDPERALQTMASILSDKGAIATT